LAYRGWVDGRAHLRQRVGTRVGTRPELIFSLHLFGRELSEISPIFKADKGMASLQIVRLS
jgi:hypothetical protein